MARTGRPREFDKAQALERALLLFWSRGYGATSVQDLVESLHLERGSLYGAFGDKRAFYLAAVRLYWETYESRLVAALETGPVLPALREVLATPTRAEEHASDLGIPQGCMIGNTTAELVPQDADAAEVVAHAHARFTEIIADALRRAQESGEVTTTATPEAQAQLLLFTVQGLSLVSRAGLDTTAALAAIDALLTGLRA
ncbi:TetR/AcrR family transcriptional regulator [Phaeacidiphilus oryzae]|uniref:TetR/AcrR family transcriptional regulator n=1 Tax=Phaeacidiphilus oryzae TaxID=348818 RepID=UPI0005605B46|nr:TetR/AcrR family transcriptional regulator [Phaeacidiphilus oryzae]